MSEEEDKLQTRLKSESDVKSNVQDTPKNSTEKERPQKDAGGDPDKFFVELKERTQNARPSISTLIYKTAKTMPFKEIIQNERARRQKIQNDNQESDQRLKSRSLLALFIFLGLETFVTFLLAFAQGFNYKEFYLDDWSLRIIIVATLGQITAMLLIAVRHLFPNNSQK